MLGGAKWLGMGKMLVAGAVQVDSCLPPDRIPGRLPGWSDGIWVASAGPVPRFLVARFVGRFVVVVAFFTAN